jgi:hypothetical protein
VIGRAGPRSRFETSRPRRSMVRLAPFQSRNGLSQGLNGSKVKHDNWGVLEEPAFSSTGSLQAQTRLDCIEWSLSIETRSRLMFSIP